MRQLMGRLFNVIFISLIYTGIVIILDAVAIYYFKLNAPVTIVVTGFAPIFPDTCYHLTHYWPAAVDIPVASD
ncbi:hypothetical protein QK313_31080, partial [Klebsiella michiganensis]|nr:hypothetical protein [Klebsiella michiganensis]